MEADVTTRTSSSETDERLLALLSQNSRRTVSELADSLGLSRQAVQNRIARLTERGVIRRFTIERGDEEQPARNRVMFTLKLRQASCASLFTTLKTWPELLQCWSLTGEDDMVVVAEAVGPDDADRMRASLSRHPDVQEVRTAHVLKSWKD
jgi:Lrp/AsnC family transcriptional regulator, leucine-responsive regulatory protein